MKLLSSLVAGTAGMLALMSSTAVVSAQDSARKCNGAAELCGRRYDQVAYATTHNAFSMHLPNPAGNQHRPISRQLSDGIRGFMVDVHAFFPDFKNFGPMRLCHVSCFLLDAGTFIDTLNVFKAFLDTHPNEVVTIFIENYDNFTPEKIAAVFKQANLDKMVWTQPAGADAPEWPTLNEMIDQNKRLVVMLESGANTASVPWLHDSFSMYAENNYHVERKQDWPCTITRPTEGGQSRKLLNINHFKYFGLKLFGFEIAIPDVLRADYDNTLDQFHKHLDTCKAVGTTANRIPNYISVDFYEKGDIFQIVDEINGVKAVYNP
ncbi:PLC-like phosphodiesterase [Ramicandelaber brevisporus]|nr:PLC-like phosphodiesterase [Ramicandelaber brevisporus]